MANDLVMPKLGLTMTEGVLAEWQVASGDMVKAGQILFVVETDKLATEVEAPSDGQIVELVAQAGETLAVGAVVGRWTGQGALAAEEQEPAATATTPVAVAAPVVPAVARADVPADGRVIATPLARRIARQKGIDLRQIDGSGPRGRIKARDVEQIEPLVTGAFAGAPASATHQAATSMQLTVARRLSASKREIPHFYLAAEADLGPLMALRAQLNNDEKRARLSVNHFILAAVAHAWADNPDANRIWHEDGFLLLPSVDVGFAVDTPRGLFAPVLRDVASLDLDALGIAADALAARARDGRLRGEDLSGSAVTVSNVGMHGVTYLTPIINPGQSAILGVGTVRSVFRPDEQDRPVLKRELGLVLACDHRVFNGVAAARLLETIVKTLETPLCLLRGTPRKGPNSAI